MIETIEETNDHFIKDYDFEIIIKRKSDGKGTSLTIDKLYEIFQIDFLIQLFQHIRKIEGEKNEHII